MTTFVQALAATLRAERAAARFTMRALAAESGVPLRTLVRYLDGERPVPMEQFILLADALGQKPSQLMADAERRQEQDQT